MLLVDDAWLVVAHTMRRHLTVTGTRLTTALGEAYKLTVPQEKATTFKNWCEQVSEARAPVLITALEGRKELEEPQDSSSKNW